MSLLADLENERVPRSNELARRVGVRIMGTWKLVLMGLLWLLTVANFAGLVFMLVAIIAMRLCGTHKGDTIEQVIGLGAFGASQIVAWTWFAARARRLRDDAAAVGREGTLIDGAIIGVHDYRGARRYTWSFMLDGTSYWDMGTLVGEAEELALQRPITVIARPGSRYGLMFVRDGDGHVTKPRPTSVRR